MGINLPVRICCHLVVIRNEVPEYKEGEEFSSLGECERCYDIRKKSLKKYKGLWKSPIDIYEEDGMTVEYRYIAHRVQDDCSVVSE